MEQALIGMVRVVLGDHKARIRFFDSDHRERSFVATIVQQGGEWRVKTIEKIAPVRQSGG